MTWAVCVCLFVKRNCGGQNVGMDAFGMERADYGLERSQVRKLGCPTSSPMIAVVSFSSFWAAPTSSFFGPWS
jgi:hypothetical protein